MPRTGRKRNKTMGKRATTREGRQPKDAGTMDGLLKKAMVLKAKLVWDGHTPRFISLIDNKEIAVKYAEYPLGILYAQKLIMIQQHDIGLLFDKYRRYSGVGLRPIKGGGLQDYIDNGSVRVEYDEDLAIRATARYKDGCKSMTAPQRLAVLNICSHGHFDKADTLWLKTIREGLDNLIKCYIRGKSK